MHSFEHGIVGPGYFKRIREREKSLATKGRKMAKTKHEKDRKKGIDFEKGLKAVKRVARAYGRMVKK